MFQRYSKQIKILSERHLNPELLGVSSETKTIKIRRKEEKEKKNHRAVFTVDRYPHKREKTRAVLARHGYPSKSGSFDQ